MIGEGGSGVVYVAQQNQPVRRRVALKVIKLGMDTRSVIARLKRQLGFLNHCLVKRARLGSLRRPATLKKFRSLAQSSRNSRKQPDLEWSFETAATSKESREKVLEAVTGASEHVKAALQLGNEEGKIVWWWPMLTLLARRG